MSTSYRHHFSHALKAAPNRLHFAAHSHHLWPDVTRDAHLQSWEDAAQHADRKWDAVFETLIPDVQQHITTHLQLSDPSTCAFAPNTHELVVRLLSCMPQSHPPRIVTTDSEFHSASRQMARLEEEGLLEITRIATQPFASFPMRFAEAAAAAEYDMIFCSQVMFNSGYVVPDIHALISTVRNPECFIVIDGYHGFMAVPTDLSAVESRIFYLGGGYKYAMAGEGACFMHCPKGYGERPLNTGWLAAFGALERGEAGGVAYAQDGGRFWGATFDPSGLYRFCAVQRWMQDNGITIPIIHEHVQALQSRFIAGLEGLHHTELSANRLMIDPAQQNCGHFITFETAQAADLYESLLECDVITDYRGTRLRFGFALYHTAADVDALLERMASMPGSGA